MGYAESELRLAKFGAVIKTTCLRKMDFRSAYKRTEKGRAAVATFVLACIVLFGGCDIDNSMKRGTYEGGRPTCGVFRKIDFEGHKYLSYTDGPYLHGVLHDPDCPCMKQPLDDIRGRVEQLEDHVSGEIQ